VKDSTSAAVPSSPSAATVLFNLPGYCVIDVVRDDGKGREGDRIVTVVSTATEGACPRCGVLTSRVHQRTTQRLRDVSVDGVVTVLWVKRRWRCAEDRCPRMSFAEHTDQVPPRARMTTRLKHAVVDAVAGEVRSVDRVASQFGVSWPTVMRLLSASLASSRLVTAGRWDRPRLVRRLGIDEHRFRSVRWFRDPDDPGAEVAAGRAVDDLSGGPEQRERHRPGRRARLQGRLDIGRGATEVVAVSAGVASRSSRSTPLLRSGPRSAGCCRRRGSASTTSTSSSSPTTP
jgi:hypothetical protein